MLPNVSSPTPPPEEDDWLKASEARYDSMKVLLQSVRRDIDVLTTRIDQTSHGPHSPALATEDDETVCLHPDSKLTHPVIRRNQKAEEKHDSPLRCPDLLANVHKIPYDLEDSRPEDEFMDIKIRELAQPTPSATSTGRQSRCGLIETAENSEMDIAYEAQSKTWRSPSDFNIFDPFKGEVISSDFSKPLSTPTHEPHIDQEVKETDLDDLSSGHYENENDSADSLSPAVSPTFEKHTTENFTLDNMLMTSDENGHFRFETDSETKMSNTPGVYELYDNGHALTTIDEASEENEDDWSSSEPDTSLTSNDSAHASKASHDSNHVTADSNRADPAGSIKADFKSDNDSNLEPLIISVDCRDMYSSENNECRSRLSAVEGEHTFIFDPSNIHHTESTGAVLLRPKRVQNARPLSTGSLAAIQRLPDSTVPSDSVQSVISIVSQESMISEADSYVTVGSRQCTTGSEDVYTTACSDSEMPIQIRPDYWLHKDDDECPTLCRKRTKLPRGQRHRQNDLIGDESSSDEDPREHTIVRTPDPIVVTPTFTRLPSRIASPSDIENAAKLRKNMIADESKEPIDHTESTTQSGPLSTHRRVLRQRPEIEFQKQTRDSEEETKMMRQDSHSQPQFRKSTTQDDIGHIKSDSAKESTADVHGKIPTRLSLIEEAKCSSSAIEPNSDIDEQPGGAPFGDEGEVVVPRYIFVPTPSKALNHPTTSTPILPARENRSGGASLGLGEQRLVNTEQPITAKVMISENVLSVGQVKDSQSNPIHTAHAPQTKLENRRQQQEADRTLDSIDTVQQTEDMYRRDDNVYETAANYYTKNSYNQERTISTGANYPPDRWNQQPKIIANASATSPLSSDYDIVQRLRSEDTRDVQVLGRPTEHASSRLYISTLHEPGSPRHAEHARLIANGTSQVSHVRSSNHHPSSRQKLNGAEQFYHPQSVPSAEHFKVNSTNSEHPVVQKGLSENSAFPRTIMADILGKPREHTEREIDANNYEPVVRNDDIRLGSQRTSRVADGKNDLGQTSVKLISAPQTNYLVAERDVTLNVTESCQKSVEMMQHKLEAEVLKAPNSAQRTSSPSPLRSAKYRQNPRVSSPAVRPKWHLKPIPTDTEIRERLRNRSRQRTEERQSRPSKTSQPSSYRPRSSRSDSRYRCTDLDSAIAEFRTETGGDTMPTSAYESVGLSETRQSASLFELDAQLDNSRKGSYHRGATHSPSRKMLGDAKSYNSLLETDIDTGENFERPIVLEADVDNIDVGDAKNQKARSLFNLTSSYTPSTYRRHKEVELNSAIGSNNWERTKSLQGLPDQQIDGNEKSEYLHHGKSSGAKGLLDRLKERAKSTHELRVAQSLTKLKVPEWLDKAECLSRSVTENDNKLESERYVPKYRTYGLTKTSSSREPMLDRFNRPSNSSIRSLSGMRRPGESITSNWLPKSSTNIETVAEPNRPRALASQQPQFIRPSQEYRERGSSLSRLRPIESKLYNSMRSHATARFDGDKPQVAPRVLQSSGQTIEMKLSPQDFVPRYEPMRQAPNKPFKNDALRKTTTVPTQATSVYEKLLPTLEYKDGYNTEATNQQHPKTLEDIKPADYDSGTENSAEKQETCKKNGIEISRTPENKRTTMTTVSNKLEEEQPNLEVPVHEEQQPSLDWNSIDADGETESEATDGLDQISDLTCLTSLVDTCASRHRALLANRPTALEHLLTSLGWWPTSIRADHRFYPPTAAEAISIAAHEFDVDEDSHRTEFLQLLAGPESRRPINLGEFALNHLSSSVQRKQEDGLLYISCGRSECTQPPVRVEKAMHWCACSNCYTLYCSPTCRAMDRRASHDHPTVCSFARAKRVCNRVLRGMTLEQLTGLTALAKTGVARLGRGGILLPFALIKHAEIFLQRCRARQLNRTESKDDPENFSCWENQHQPSPGGLMCPPLYLTLNELEELDSTVAIPCRSYTTTSSMVIIVVVCAYELIARADGRPVHLFKQSMVLPFPVHTSGNGTGSKSPTVHKQVPHMISNTNGQPVRPDNQAQANREAYMIRLQRILRERGVSLRHHYPDIYMHIANFVETGVPFAPIQLVFHDFVLREEVLCAIQPMLDPIIQPTRTLSQTEKPTNGTPQGQVQRINQNVGRMRETQF